MSLSSVRRLKEYVINEVSCSGLMRFCLILCVLSCRVLIVLAEFIQCIREADKLDLQSNCYTTTPMTCTAALSQLNSKITRRLRSHMAKLWEFT